MRLPEEGDESVGEEEEVAGEEEAEEDEGAEEKEEEAPETGTGAEGCGGSSAAACCWNCVNMKLRYACSWLRNSASGNHAIGNLTRRCVPSTLLHEVWRNLAHIPLLGGEERFERRKLTGLAFLGESFCKLTPK